MQEENINNDVSQVVTTGLTISNNKVSVSDTVQNAIEYFEKQDQIRKYSIKVTSAIDWIDQRGTPYLQWSGASKIAQAFGVSYDSPDISKELCKDENGEYVEFTVMGTIRWRERSVTEIGTGSTRDDFFGKSKGQFKPLKDINLVNIKKKAMTNWLNRGLKSLLGLKFTWEEIEKYSDGLIRKGGTTQVQSKNQEVSEQGKGIKEEIKSMLNEMYGDKWQQRLKELTTYPWKKKDENGNEKEIIVEGKTNIDQVSEKGLNTILPKVRKEFEEFNKGK